MAVNYQLTVGRRKTSTARVFLYEGSGNITINGKSAIDFFKKESILKEAIDPLNVIDMRNKFDVVVNVKGGGVTGQLGAIRLGISRAIMKYDASLKVGLKKENMLTRDSRMVERKKSGQPKARKRFQFSKR